MNFKISSLVAIIAAITAIITAHRAHRACSAALRELEWAMARLSVAMRLASDAASAARLAIDRVSSSRASRLAEESAARSNSFCLSHSSATCLSKLPVRIDDSRYRTSDSPSRSSSFICSFLGAGIPGSIFVLFINSSV